MKAKNGFWHSFYFTTGTFHEPIQITPGNREVTEKACRKCHAAVVAAIDPMPGHRPSDKTSCSGATDAQLSAARGFQKKAQFLVDFIEAENSMGFHAPQEAARVLVKSVDYSRQGQVAVRGGTTGAPAAAVAAAR